MRLSRPAVLRAIGILVAGVPISIFLISRPDGFSRLVGVASLITEIALLVRYSVGYFVGGPVAVELSPTGVRRRLGPVLSRDRKFLAWSQLGGYELTRRAGRLLLILRGTDGTDMGLPLGSLTPADGDALIDEVKRRLSPRS